MIDMNTKPGQFKAGHGYRDIYMLLHGAACYLQLIIVSIGSLHSGSMDVQAIRRYNTFALPRSSY
jgi:hypothetical protein